MSAELLTDLLREPALVVERCRRSQGLRELAATALICLIGGAALFGGVLGSFRGGPQIAFSAFKLPLALLATLVVSVPAFFALAIGFGGRTQFRSMAALTLTAAARGALVLAACAPVLWLAVDRGLGYHGSVMLSACMYVVAGCAALEILVRGFGGALRSLVTSVACGIVFFAVLGQTAWMLRPFLGRPDQSAVPFVRQREGSFADSLRHSGKSALGIYDAARTAPRSSTSTPQSAVAHDPGPNREAEDTRTVESPSAEQRSEP
jgi:hypothetical protein